MIESSEIAKLYTLGFGQFLEDLLTNRDYTVIGPAASEGPLFASLTIRNPIGAVFHITVEQVSR